MKWEVRPPAPASPAQLPHCMDCLHTSRTGCSCRSAAASPARGPPPTLPFRLALLPCLHLSSLQGSDNPRVKEHPVAKDTLLPMGG